MSNVDTDDYTADIKMFATALWLIFVLVSFFPWGELGISFFVLHQTFLPKLIKIISHTSFFSRNVLEKAALYLNNSSHYRWFVAPKMHYFFKYISIHMLVTFQKRGQSIMEGQKLIYKCTVSSCIKCTVTEAKSLRTTQNTKTAIALILNMCRFILCESLDL